MKKSKVQNKPKSLRPLLGKTVASSLLLMPLIGTTTAFAALAGFGINLFPNESKTFTYETVFQSTYVPGASVSFGNSGIYGPLCSCTATVDDANAQFTIFASGSIGLFYPTLTAGSTTQTLDVYIQNAFAKTLPVKHIDAGSTLHLAPSDLFSILSPLNLTSVTVTLPSSSSADFTAFYNTSSSTLDIHAGGSGLSSATINIGGNVSGTVVSNTIQVVSDNVAPVKTNAAVPATKIVGEQIDLGPFFTDHPSDTIQSYNVTLSNPGFFSQTGTGGQYLNALKSGVTQVTVSATDSRGAVSESLVFEVTVFPKVDISPANLPETATPSDNGTIYMVPAETGVKDLTNAGVAVDSFKLIDPDRKKLIPVQAGQAITLSNLAAGVRTGSYKMFMIASNGMLSDFSATFQLYGQVTLPNLTLEVGEGLDIPLDLANLLPQYPEINRSFTNADSSSSIVNASRGLISDNQLHLLANWQEGISTITITAFDASNVEVIRGVFQVRVAPTVINQNQSITFKTDINSPLYIVPYDYTASGNNLLATAPAVDASTDGHFYSVFTDTSKLKSDTLYTLFADISGAKKRVRDLKFHFVSVPKDAAQAKLDIGDLVKYVNANPGAFSGETPLNKSDLLQLLEGGSLSRTMNGNMPYLILNPPLG